MKSNSLQRIIQWVEKKLGLKTQSMSLLIWKDKIQERIKACQLDSYEQYENWLQSSDREEMQELIELIVNSETWFFRERGAFDSLICFIKQNQRKMSCFRILSLACSSGEEPYSIAMTLLDAGLSLNDFRIDALDISHKALKKAQAGIYRKFSFREVDLDFRDRYFDDTGSGYAIKSQIKQQVFFYEGNLLEDGMLFEPQSYSIIFCRNLLIYLNQDVQMSLLQDLKMLLAPQGILIVGLAEGRIALNAGFELVVLPKTHVFTLPSPKNNQRQSLKNV